MSRSRPGRRAVPGVGAELSYRAQARLATDRHRGIELVDAANSVRPRTWV